MERPPLLNRIMIRLIRWYQRRGGGDRYLIDCNFEPTCSEYGRQAFEKYSFCKAFKLTFQRIRRCNDPDCWPRKHDPLP